MQQENSLEVSKSMKLKKELKEKENKINELENEIKHLWEILWKKEMEEMKEEIRMTFKINLLKPEFDSFLTFSIYLNSFKWSGGNIDW